MFVRRLMPADWQLLVVWLGYLSLELPAFSSDYWAGRPRTELIT